MPFLLPQDVQGAVHSELDIPLHDGAGLQAMDCVVQRGAADGALHRLLLLLFPGLEEQQEAAAPCIGQLMSSRMSDQVGMSCVHAGLPGRFWCRVCQPVESGPCVSTMDDSLGGCE